jgi:hypothetical protein
MAAAGIIFRSGKFLNILLAPDLPYVNIKPYG